MHTAATARQRLRQRTDSSAPSTSFLTQPFPPFLPPWPCFCSLVSVHSWSYAESLDFFSQATSYTKCAVPAGVSVYHETHRGRALYNPWVCRDLVRALPDLMLTADYSHWYARPLVPRAGQAWAALSCAVLHWQRVDGRARPALSSPPFRPF